MVIVLKFQFFSFFEYYYFFFRDINVFVVIFSNILERFFRVWYGVFIFVIKLNGLFWNGFSKFYYFGLFFLCYGNQYGFG